MTNSDNSFNPIKIWDISRYERQRQIIPPKPCNPKIVDVQLSLIKVNKASHLSLVTSLLDILFEDEDLLVVNKPAGLVCHPTKAGPLSSLISRVRLHSGSSAALVNRLDRETSGVTIVAKNPATAGLLGKIWEKRAVEKEYLAIVHGTVSPNHDLIDLPLGKDENSQIAVKDHVRPDGAPAQTEFRVERHFRRDDSDFTLLRLMPRTGRKHQIRIHLAAVGHPVVGDKLYGGNEDYYLALAQNRLTPEDWRQLRLPNHALHARTVRFAWRDAIQAFSAPPEGVFRDWAGWADGEKAFTGGISDAN